MLARRESLLWGLLVLLLWMASVAPFIGWGPYLDDIQLPYHHHQLGLQWHQVFWTDNGVGFLRPAYQFFVIAVAPLFGMQWWAWNAGAALVHLAAVFAVWRFATVFSGEARIGPAVALAFVAHPGHWTVHWWAAAAGDSILVLGSMIALLSWRRWHQTREVRWFLGSLGGVLLAASGKEQAALLGPLILALEVALQLRERIPLRDIVPSALRRTWPWLLVGIALLVLFVTVDRGAAFRFRDVAPPNPLRGMTLQHGSDYIAAQYWPYASLVWFPEGPLPPLVSLEVNAHHEHPQGSVVVREFVRFLSAAVVLGILWVCIRRRRPVLLVLLLWALVLAAIPASLQWWITSRYAYSIGPPLLTVTAAAVWPMLSHSRLLRRLAAVLFAAWITLGAWAHWHSPSVLPARWATAVSRRMLEQLPAVAASQPAGGVIRIIAFPLLDDDFGCTVYAVSMVKVSGAGDPSRITATARHWPLPEDFAGGRTVFRWDERRGQLTLLRPPPKERWDSPIWH